MLKYIKYLIVRSELRKLRLKASSEAQFFDMLCNIYNDRNSF